jgi:hypothetical protein
LIFEHLLSGVNKKIKKSIKSRKLKKKNKKNRTVKKNRLKFWKNRPVWFSFGFISLKSKKPNRTETKKNPEKTRAKQKKTDPNRKNRAKNKKTEPNRKNRANRFEQVFVKKTEPNWNRSVWTSFGYFFQKQISVW